jgi:hypothetical protein
MHVLYPPSTHHLPTPCTAASHSLPFHAATSASPHYTAATYHPSTPGGVPSLIQLPPHPLPLPIYQHLLPQVCIAAPLFAALDADRTLQTMLSLLLPQLRLDSHAIKLQLNEGVPSGCAEC